VKERMITVLHQIENICKEIEIIFKEPNGKAELEKYNLKENPPKSINSRC
jgi:hypothetical protein